MQPAEQARPKRGYDQALKWMLSQAPDAVLALIAPGLTWQSELSPELPAVARQADLVWEIADTVGEHGVLHIELQTKPDADMGERVAEYGLRLWLREHKPVRSVVLFLRSAPAVPSSPFVIHWQGHESLRYTYDVIKLWEVPQERVLDSSQPTLWPLASLMAGATPETTLAVAERIANAPVTRQERSELIGLLATLADLRLPLTSVLDVLRRNPMFDELLEESNVGQYSIKKGEQRMAQRMAESTHAAVAESERRMARAALEGRFGTLDQDVLAAINAADEATLQAVVARSAIESLEQLRARLGLR